MGEDCRAMNFQNVVKDVRYFTLHVERIAKGECQWPSDQFQGCDYNSILEKAQQLQERGFLQNPAQAIAEFQEISQSLNSCMSAGQRFLQGSAWAPCAKISETAAPPMCY